MGAVETIVVLALPLVWWHYRRVRAGRIMAGLWLLIVARVAYCAARGRSEASLLFLSSDAPAWPILLLGMALGAALAIGVAWLRVHPAAEPPPTSADAAPAAPPEPPEPPRPPFSVATEVRLVGPSTNGGFELVEPPHGQAAAAVATFRVAPTAVFPGYEAVKARVVYTLADGTEAFRNTAGPWAGEAVNRVGFRAAEETRSLILALRSLHGETLLPDDQRDDVAQNRDVVGHPIDTDAFIARVQLLDARAGTTLGEWAFRVTGRGSLAVEVITPPSA
jgi:hypothetical protein